MTTIPNFRVEAGAGGRFYVDWRDETYRYCFACVADGDAIQEVLPSALRKFPTIYRSEINGRKRVDYLNAQNYEELCAGIASRILAEGLFTKARAEANERRAQREAEIVAQKAEFMRGVLADLGDDLETADTDLAAAYDRIQNGVL